MNETVPTTADDAPGHGDPAVDAAGSAVHQTRAGLTEPIGAPDRSSRPGPLGRLDEAAYALFARHADDRRHDGDRVRYRGAPASTSFGTFVARLYALSWVACLLALPPAFVFASTVAPTIAGRVTRTFARHAAFAPLVLSPSSIVVALTVVAGATTKRATVALGGHYLRWLVAARRTRIERTLPGAVRYLDVLAAGSDDARTMIARVAGNEAYGGTAVSFRKALNAARLTGSLDAGLRRVARDTPSRDLLAPFLLKFRHHLSQGDDALARFLRTESRLLSHRQEHAQTRARRYLQPVAELFVFVLVVPALLVVAVTVASAFVPALSRPVETPVGTVSPRAVAVYLSVCVLLAVGIAGVAATSALRPTGSHPSYRRPSGTRGSVTTALSNPASTTVVAAPAATLVGGWLAYAGYPLVTVALLSYVAFALPVGLVAARRRRLDDAKDRRLTDFVYAVARQTSIGRPFPAAVTAAAREVDLGVLSADVASLAFALSMSTTGDTGGVDASGPRVPAAGDVRTSALDRFVDRIDTPLADRTVGLVAGALHAGAAIDAVFETLQIEVDRLTHETRALREAMRRYVVGGWAAALSVAGLVALINVAVMDAGRLASIAAVLGEPFDAVSVVPALERFRLYVVAQATLLASGWFAGAAAGGRYGALLHSGLLVGACYVGFVGLGVV